MRTKPLIGVTPLYDNALESVWMIPGYLEVLSACGALPVILPFAPADAALMAQECDGLLFTGGNDISPSLYEEEPDPACGELCPRRDELEYALLSEALNRDVPLLGICRGAQFINAALGGSLYQDIPSQMPAAVSHCMKSPYDRHWHKVSLMPDTPLSSLLKTTTLPVNSYHHQGIRELSFQLCPMAYSPDGLVEAFYHSSKTFTWGVLWHPEFLWQKDHDQRIIFQAFVDACSGFGGLGVAGSGTKAKAKRKGSPFLLSL